MAKTDLGDILIIGMFIFVVCAIFYNCFYRVTSTTGQIVNYQVETEFPFPPNHVITFAGGTTQGGFSSSWWYNNGNISISIIGQNCTITTQGLWLKGISCN